VFGHPNLRNAVSIGPLELVGARQAARLAPGAFRAHAGRYQAIKVLAVVRGTDDVTLTVPPSARAALALLYDPAVRANRSGFRFSAGDPRVTFEACGSTDANYNGGFLATRPICVSLQVSTASMRAEGRVSLGTGPSCQA
jgi:hypothetical protein